jgi:hypothetical protein
MVALLEALWKVLDLLSALWNLLCNWRLVLSILVALGAVFVLRQYGVPLERDSFIIAALIGLVAGVAWELLSAAGSVDQLVTARPPVGNNGPSGQRRVLDLRPQRGDRRRSGSMLRPY